MASTTVKIEDQVTSKGTITVKEGELRGNRGRMVILEAAAAQGYVFDRWEIETFSVKLRQFGIVGQRFDSIDQVCSSPNADLTTPLYSDGSLLYTDEEGKYPATTGYWYAGRGTYYNYNGANLPSIQTCSQGSVTVEPTTSNGGGGGGTIVRGFGPETTFEDNTRTFI